MNQLQSPLNSLQQGNWVKLICGASLQHLPSVRNLTLAYALAGVDCVDVSADPAVIAAAREALLVARQYAQEARCHGIDVAAAPWIMVSINDGEDPHFRKAEFDATACPPACPRPCETICPAQAIAFGSRLEEMAAPSFSHSFSGAIDSGINGAIDSAIDGVIDERCYGCGRCITVCPSALISARSYVMTPQAVAPLVLGSGVDAVEIHTQVGRLQDFKRLWQAIAPLTRELKAVAISCQDAEGFVDYLRSLYEYIAPLPCALIWQADGRPMSGDLGKGTTHAAIALARKILAANLPGYVQLAGGTNDRTVAHLQANGLLATGRSSGRSHPQAAPSASRSTVAGVAYGSYARVLLSSILEQLETMPINPIADFQASTQSALHVTRPTSVSSLIGGDSNGRSPTALPNTNSLEHYPELLWQAVRQARAAIAPLKAMAFQVSPSRR